MTKLVQTTSSDGIREEQFVGDREMAEILTNKKLQKRMKQGSRAARRTEGRFVK